MKVFKPLPAARRARPKAAVVLPFPFPVAQWKDGAVVLLDQTLLPGKLEFRRCADIPSLCRAIRELAVRGAPAIGVAAAYGLALSWNLNKAMI